MVSPEQQSLPVQSKVNKTQRYKPRHMLNRKGWVLFLFACESCSEGKVMRIKGVRDAGF